MSLTLIGAVIKNSNVRSLRSSANSRMVNSGKISSRMVEVVPKIGRKTMSFKLTCAIPPCICIMRMAWLPALTTAIWARTPKIRRKTAATT